MEETHGMRPLAARPHDDPHLRPCTQCGSDNGINAARCWRCAAALPPVPDPSLDAPSPGLFDLDAAATDAWPPNVFAAAGAPATAAATSDTRTEPTTASRPVGDPANPPLTVDRGATSGREAAYGREAASGRGALPHEDDREGAGARRSTTRPVQGASPSQPRPPSASDTAPRSGTPPPAGAAGDRLRHPPGQSHTSAHGDSGRRFAGPVSERAGRVSQRAGPVSEPREAAHDGAPASRAANREAAALDALARSQALAERFADRRTSGRRAARRRQAIVASVVVVTLAVLIVGYPVYRGMEPLGLTLPDLAADRGATARSDAAAPSAAPEAAAPEPTTAQANERSAAPAAATMAAPAPAAATTAAPAPAAPTTRAPAPSALEMAAPSPTATAAASPIPTAPATTPSASTTATAPAAHSVAASPAPAPDAAGPAARDADNPGPTPAPPTAAAPGTVARETQAAAPGTPAVPSPAQREVLATNKETASAPEPSAPGASAAKTGDVPSPRARLRSLGLAGALEAGAPGASGASDANAAVAAGAHQPGAAASEAVGDPAPAGGTPSCTAALAALALCSPTAVEGTP
jgi:hypothetical protein